MTSSRYAEVSTRDLWFVPETSGVRVPREVAQDEYGGDDPAMIDLAAQVARYRAAKEAGILHQILESESVMS